MPSGRVHNLINLAAFAVLGTSALVLARAGAFTLEPREGLAFALGYFAGTFLLSPDLDLAEGHVDSKRAWGLLGVLWVPYGLMFSHRGWSHSWIVGPLTRLVYLGLMVALVLGVVALVWPPVLAWRPEGLAWPVGAALLAGYYLSQWLHLVADGIRPDHKMRLKRKRRR